MTRLIDKFTVALDRYLKTDVKQLLASNAWLSLTRFVGTTSGVLLTLAFANILVPEQFGVYKYVLASAGMISAFTLTGLNTAVTRAVAQKKDVVIRSVFKFGVITSIPASLISLIISTYYFYQNNLLLGTSFFVVAFTTPLLANLGISKAIILGKEDYKTYAIFNSLGSVIPVLLLLIVLIVTKKVLLVIVAYFLINLVSGTVIYIATLRKYKIPKDKNFNLETIRYGQHLSIIGFFSQISNQIDHLLIWHFTGPAALATYALSLAPIREMRTVLENIFPIIFPRFARNHKEVVKKRLPLRTIQFAIVCLTAVITYIIFAPYIYKYLFPQYMDSVGASQLLALTILLLPRGITETFLTAHGAVRIRYIVTISSLLFKISAFIILIPLYGIIGAILAIIITDIVSSLLLFFYYKKF